MIANLSRVFLYAPGGSKEARIYDMGRVTDESETLLPRITLETGDMDQPLFAQQHPAEAAQGMRGFFLDAYQPNGLISGGQ